MKNKFKIYTLGCKVNQYDSNNLSRQLIASGFALVKENADWAIVNTCAVTKNAIRKGRQIIVKARRENPEAKIILMGCFPKIYKNQVEELGVDYVFGVREGEKALGLLKSKLNLNSCFENGVASSLSLLAMADEKSRYFLKIQDGCEQFCTYCVIPYTRGKLQSRGEEEIVQEFKKVVEAGFREIVLTGIHLGKFKIKNEKLKMNNLVYLINRLLKINNNFRIRLSSIEVNEISDKLINLISENKKLCNHLHIPLQSGCDKILKLMNRPYDKKYFRNKVGKIRKLVPNIAISIDVIVGFPGESKEDFQETCDFIEELNFSKLHVFPFSAHEKTPAFNFPNQIDRKITLNRAEKLRKIGDRLENNFRKRFTGKEVEVLVEQIKDDKIIGKTGEYLGVEIPIEKLKNEKIRVGEIVKVVL